MRSQNKTSFPQATFIVIVCWTVHKQPPPRTDNFLTDIGKVAPSSNLDSQASNVINTYSSFKTVYSKKFQSL